MIATFYAVQSAALTVTATNDEDIKPGWVALVIVLTLCVVTVLLWLNMRKQLGRVNFEEAADPVSGVRNGDREDDGSSEVAGTERPPT